MKKQYIKPITNGNGLCCESHLCAGSLKGDGLQMDINSNPASGDAESRRGSFWDDSE